MGITDDNRAVYEFERMVEGLCQSEGWSREEAKDWIDYNVIPGLPNMGQLCPIIVYGV